MKKLLLVGGGTGGHAFPLLNLVQYLRKVQSSELKVPSLGTRHSALGTDFHWIGEANSIESKLCEDNNIPFLPIICGKLRRYFSIKTLLLPFQILTGIIQSLMILHREKPAAIFSKGGYVSLPVAIAGWIVRIPIYLHESDSVPGLANRIVAKFSTGIFSAFLEADSFFKGQNILGHGVLFSQDLAMIANESLLVNPKTQLLVSCGSQWSSTILNEVLDILKTENWKLKIMDVHIVLGVKNLDYRKQFEGFPNVALYDFFYDQSEYLRLVKQCDVVIARSGSSIFEFEALGLHMILIPHPHTGNNHQYWNARAFEKKGHELVPQDQIKILLPEVLEKYQHFKKSWEKIMVDMSIFDTIATTLSLL